MARPQIEVYMTQLETLAKIHCTMVEIASVLKVSERTLRRRFGRIIETHRAGGRTSLRRAQWSKALAGNPTMMIWLGKQELGQRDQIAVASEHMSDAPDDPKGLLLNRLRDMHDRQVTAEAEGVIPIETAREA